MKETGLEILMDLHVLSPLEYEEVFFECCLSVCTLEPQWVNRFHSYSVLKSLPIIGQCLVNMNILAQKIGPFRWTSKNKIMVFLKTTVAIMCSVFAMKYCKMCSHSFLNTESEVHSNKGARPRKRKAGGGYGYFSTLNSSKKMHKNKVYRQPNRKPGDTRQFSQ